MNDFYCSHRWSPDITTTNGDIIGSLKVCRGCNAVWIEGTPEPEVKIAVSR